jgi:Sec-independent protein translocase protein TatA
LAEQDSFPDLQGWEDSGEKIRQAHEAVGRLRRYLKEQEDEIQSRTEREEAKKRHQARQVAVSKSRQDLEKLNSRLTDLSRNLGVAEAGYAFQDWFYDLLDFCEVVNRRPYNHGGRQIDGSLTCADTTYLVELKFTGEQATVTDIDSFLKKVNDKADNTMGVMVSICGYSSVAIQGASGPKTPLLLLDAGHLFLVLYGTMRFEDVLSRVRRHASQTAEAYLRAERFSGS